MWPGSSGSLMGVYGRKTGSQAPDGVAFVRSAAMKNQWWRLSKSFF